MTCSVEPNASASVGTVHYTCLHVNKPEDPGIWSNYTHSVLHAVDNTHGLAERSPGPPSLSTDHCLSIGPAFCHSRSLSNLPQRGFKEGGNKDNSD